MLILKSKCFGKRYWALKTLPLHATMIYPKKILVWANDQEYIDEIKKLNIPNVETRLTNK